MRNLGFWGTVAAIWAGAILVLGLTVVVGWLSTLGEVY